MEAKGVEERSAREMEAGIELKFMGNLQGEFLFEYPTGRPAQRMGFLRLCMMAGGDIENSFLGDTVCVYDGRGAVGGEQGAKME